MAVLTGYVFVGKVLPESWDIAVLMASLAIAASGHCARAVCFVACLAVVVVEIKVVLDDGVDFVAYGAILFEYGAPCMRRMARCATLVLAEHLLVIQNTPRFLMARSA